MKLGGNLFRREHLLENLGAVQDSQRRRQRPGDDPAQHRISNGEAAKRLGRRRDDLGDRRDQRKPARAFGMVERDRKRDRAAQRMAGDDRSAELERFYHFNHRLALRAQARVGAAPPCRIARPGPIERNHPELGRKPANERIGEIPQLATETVDQE